MKIETVLTWEIDRCLEIRRTVFVGEQSVPLELEVDELDDVDAECDHFLIFYDGSSVGTFRCFYETPTTVHLQRLCVLKEYRHFGCGCAALEFAESYYAEAGADEITLNAQCKAIGFYEKCGYKTVSDIFYDAGIPHKRMTKPLI